MKRLFMLLFALVVASTSSVGSTSAQGQVDNPERAPQQLVEQAIANGDSVPEGFKVISSLNIPKTSVTDRNDRELTISYTVENKGDKLETGIRPGVNFFRIEANGAEGLVDQVFTEEAFSLSPGQEVTKELTYTVPAAFKGEFAPGVIISNTSGLILSQTSGVENFTFEEIAGSLFVEKCSLNIEGDTESYPITIGADFAINENASVICSVSNASENIIPFKPVVTVHERSLANEVAQSEEYAMEQMLPSETRDVTFYLPKISKPQAYKVRIDLLHDEFNTVLSNPVIGHFVIQGASATVQSVSLDKASYSSGDTAKLDVFIASQADYFGTSRNDLNAEIDLGSESLKYTTTTTITSNGSQCGAPVTTEAGAGFGESGSSFEVMVPISSNCPDPVASVTITAENGQQLAVSEFATDMPDDGARSAVTKIPGVNALVTEEGGIKPVVLVVVLISLLTAIAILFMKKKSSVKILLPALFVSTALLLSPLNAAQAYVLEALQNDPSQSNRGSYESSVLNFNISENTCEPNLSGTLQVNNCGNPTNDPFRGDACAVVKVNGNEALNVTVNTNNESGTDARNDGTNPTFDIDYRLPADRSSVDIQVQYASHCNFTDNAAFKKQDGNFPYVVGPCGQPTACGMRGGTRSSEPTNSQKCTNGGTPVNESFNGSRWTWDCRPTDGSTDDGGCYVDRTAPSVNGQCGNESVSSHPNGSTGCAAGNYVDVTDSSTEFLWRCEGTGAGATDDSCSASKPSAPAAACGTAAGVEQSSFPTTGLCAPGSGKNGDSETATAYTWFCGNGIDNVPCSAPKPSPVQATCGTAANATPVASQPTANLCGDGSTPTVASDTSRYFWTCLGTTPAQNSPVCEVPRQLPPAPAPACGADHNGEHLFTAPTQLCDSGTPSTPTQVGDQWQWNCTDTSNTPPLAPANCSSTSNCADEQFACNNRCVTISVGGEDQANLNRDSSPVVSGQTITVDSSDPVCQPTCTLNGQTVPLGSVPTDVEIVHGDNEVICIPPRDPQCVTYPGDDDCDPTVEFPRNISCVCQARRCSAQGQCVQTNIIASSYTDSQCADDCSACGGGSVFEPGL